MKDPRKLAEDFVTALRGALGTRLQAASLYGSAARGEWIDGLSDVNVLVLLENIDPRTLADAAPAARGALAGGLAPLPVETAEWARAADVFPIELADMKDASIPLFGDVSPNGFPADAAGMRLQAERELRAKLIQLHAGMLALAQDRKGLGEMLVRALPSFTTYLRAALRLAGKPVPRASGEVIVEGCKLTSADPAAFLRVLEARAAGGKLELNLRDPLADQFNAAAERLAAFTDAFGRSSR
jgi:predicted nucleotidyltransferase